MVEKERLARAGAVSLLGSAVSAGAALLLTVVVGRGLGAYGTGLFFQAVGLFTVATQILRLGTNSGMTRFLAEQKAHGQTGRATTTVMIALVPTTVICALATAAILLNADALASIFGSAGEEAQLADLIRLLSPFVPIAALTGVLQAAIRMLRGVAIFTLLQDVLLPLSRLALVSLAVVAAWEIVGTLEAWAASLPVFFVVTVALLVRPIARDLRARGPDRPRWQDEAKSFWAFSWARGVGAALEIGLDWADVLIVAALRSPTEAGIYAVVTRAVRAGQIVDRAMRVAVSPTISVLLARGEKISAKKLHTSVTRAMILATWPFYLTLIVMGPAVLALFGESFVPGSVALAILAAVMMMAATAGMLQSVLLMGGKSSWQMYNKGLALALNIGLNLVLVPLWGINGAAISWAVVVVVDTSLAAWQVHSGIGVRLEPLRAGKAAILPLIVFGAGGVLIRLILGVSFLDLLLYLVVLGAVYLVCCWFFRGPLGVQPLWDVFRLRARKSV